MIYSKERDKNNWYWKLCMQWTEQVVIGYIPPQHIFSFFSLISIPYMERINKAALLINLLFFGTKKEEIYQNP